MENYQASNAGSTCSPPVMPHHQQDPKWMPDGLKMADKIWKEVLSQVIGCSEQLLLNMFFDLNTLSMIKKKDVTEKKEKCGEKGKKTMMKIAVH